MGTQTMRSNQKIIFTSNRQFFEFIRYAAENGLAYRAEEQADQTYIVVVTGY